MPPFENLIKESSKFKNLVFHEDSVGKGNAIVQF